MISPGCGGLCILDIARWIMLRIPEEHVPYFALGRLAVGLRTDDLAAARLGSAAAEGARFAFAAGAVRVVLLAVFAGDAAFAAGREDRPFMPLPLVARSATASSCEN